MTDDAQSQSPTADEQPTQVTPGTPAATARSAATAAAETRPPVPPPVPPVAATDPQPGPSITDKVAALVDERPELGAGGAFAGGIVFALILKRLGR